MAEHSRNPSSKEELFLLVCMLEAVVHDWLFRASCKVDIVEESTRKKAAYLMIMGSSNPRGGCGALTILEMHTHP